MKIGFIGAGKAGFSVGKFFAEGGAELSGYASRSFASAEEAAAFTGSRAYRSVEELARGSGVIFVTTPDGAIGNVWSALRPLDLRGKYICHCSGSLSAAEAFPGARDADALVLSLHPLFPISSKYESYKELRRAFFCVEGDEEPAEYFCALLAALGANVQRIPSEGKGRYHAGCVAASNFMCALAQQAVELLCSCGFTPDGALRALAPLMRSNLEHIIELGPAAALTGPVERNDAATARRHLAVLSPEERALYRIMSAKLTELAKLRHPDVDYGEIESLVKQNRE